jgi:hypothetical protein
MVGSGDLKFSNFLSVKMNDMAIVDIKVQETFIFWKAKGNYRERWLYETAIVLFIYLWGQKEGLNSGLLLAGTLPLKPCIQCPPHLCFSYFSRVSWFCLGLASNYHTPTYPSHVAGITDVHHHTQIIGWDGVLLTFCPRWPRIAILLISASRVAGIIGVSHCARRNSKSLTWMKWIVLGKKNVKETIHFERIKIIPEIHSFKVRFITLKLMQWNTTNWHRPIVL